MSVQERNEVYTRLGILRDQASPEGLGTFPPLRERGITVMIFFCLPTASDTIAKT